MLTSDHRPQEKDQNLLLSLANLMAGDFSNQKQAFADAKNYAHIRIFFRPLPWEFFDGIGFYSEQAYDYDLWTPYRQGVHLLVERGDDVYIENYSLQDAYLYAGAGHDREILETIPKNKIERRCNCAMVFKPEGNIWRGRVEPGNGCLIEKRGKQTYLISDVELSETTWHSWDRGMDVNTHEQIWGSEVGALKFEKRASFAEELPSLLG